MELKMIGSNGAAGTVQATDQVFGRDFNEALVHQLVVAYQANARIGYARAEGPRRGQPLDQEAVAPEGHRPRARRA